MNNRNPNGSLAGSPVLVGALTVLIAIVSVFLAYNANNGLPFVKTYQLTAQVPNAEDLFENNEVRIGGTRVGVVDTVKAVQDDDGNLVAELHMKLNEDAAPVPEDSTIIVRPRSSLGLKYIEITPGHSSESFDSGDTMPLTAAKPEPVELDDFFNMWDAPTRPAIQETTLEFGNAFGGRGAQLNGAFSSLATLVDSVTPAMKNLASPQTKFGEFWRQLERLNAVVAPVSEEQAQFFTGLDLTFGAFASVAYPYLQDTISKSAPTENSLIEDMPATRPFFQHAANWFDAFRPGADALAKNSGDLRAAFTLGVPALQASPKFSDQLPETASTLVDFQTPSNFNGIDLLRDTNKFLGPLMSYITPSQTVCQYLTLLFRNAASVGSGGNGLGNYTRVIELTAPTGANNLGGISGQPADGPNDAEDQVFNFKHRNNTNHLHTNPYPNTAAPGQTYECEANNENYIIGKPVVGNVPGDQGTNTDQVVPAPPKQCKKGAKLKNGKCVKPKKPKKKKKS